MPRPRPSPRLQTLPQLLRELRRTHRRPEDVPPAVLRESQKQGFPDMRSILLPPPVIRAALRQPLLRDLLVTRAGYCSRAFGHYIPRPEGSLDHILHYCVGGHGWLRLGDKEWAIGPDTALFLPSGLPHLYGADPRDPWSIYWIHFTGRQAGEFFDALRVSPEQPVLRLPCTEDVLSALRSIEGHLAGVHTRPNLLAASTALAGFLGMVQLRRFAPDQHERTAEEGVQQTINFLEANLARPISVRELAQLARMSVSRYEKAFAARTGSPPITYLNRMRIQKACRLLNETELPIKVICGRVGCEDPYYFSRLFKKLTGISPARYRTEGFTRRRSDRSARQT